MILSVVSVHWVMLLKQTNKKGATYTMKESKEKANKGNCLNTSAVAEHYMTCDPLRQTGDKVAGKIRHI